MKIKIIGVGKLKEKYLKDGIDEYTKRLSRFVKLEILELPDEKLADKMSFRQQEQVRSIEGEKIIAHLKDDDYVVALDLLGVELTSEELAQKINDLKIFGTSKIIFIIGGSIGLSQTVLKRANFRLCFGKMTYPHQLMRLILLEQLYRSMMINHGSTYHK